MSKGKRRLLVLNTMSIIYKNPLTNLRVRHNISKLIKVMAFIVLFFGFSLSLKTYFLNKHTLKSLIIRYLNNNVNLLVLVNCPWSSYFSKL